MNWNGFCGLTSFSSGNGAQTTYTYSTSPAMSTATVNGRWSKTYYDGVGRPVKVESGDSAGVKSTVETLQDRDRVSFSPPFLNCGAVAPT